jgi:hypothetical protein
MLRLSCLAVLLSSALLAAQTRIVPPHAAAADLNDQCHFPFIYEFTRVQQLFNGGVICNTAAAITGFSMRRDAADPRSYNGRAVNLTLLLGYSSNSAATMSTTFASNRAGQQTTVFQGNYSLPNQPPVTPIAPWNVGWTLSQPFPYLRSNGNLLIEWVIPGVANQKFEYPLDAERIAIAGSSQVLGTHGPFLTGGRPTFSMTSQTSQLVPGGSVTLTESGLAQSYPAILFLGSSATSWLGLTLPFDLTVVGAPNNNLYTGVQISFGVPITLMGNTWGGNWTQGLPNDPGLGGRSLHAQMYFVHPPSNQLGLVFSNGLTLNIGGGIPYTESLGASDSNAADGFLWFGTGAAGGPAVLFTGSFS